MHQRARTTATLLKGDDDYSTSFRREGMTPVIGSFGGEVVGISSFWERSIDLIVAAVS
jgi:hypothetical protein